MTRAFIRTLLLAMGLVAMTSQAADRDWEQELARRRQRCAALLTEWRHARDPGERTRLRADLVEAAILAEQPGVVEEVAADGRPARKEIRLPRPARRVPLHALRTFEGIRTTLGQEDGYPPDASPEGGGWLVRRITQDAWEVWTPTHGWLFDGRGRLLIEAHPVRGDGTGREWFGAFLPDGRWVTTDLQEHDDRLTFFSREGERSRQLTSAELAPPGPRGLPLCLIGWARSDKEGAGWIVNVGDEQGYATVRVEPRGPARVLSGIERWELCYPRALGPRGWYIGTQVPDDAGQTLLARGAAGHGAGVGFPTYSLREAAGFSLAQFAEDQPNAAAGPVDNVRLPDGNDIFGFWPGGQDVFIGTETMVNGSGRKRVAEAPDGAIIDKTWFFDRRWRLQGWARARRLADAADGRAMLLRTDDDGRVVTLGPDLQARATRLFVWPGGETADALMLFDDLWLGVFTRGGTLVLAGW